MPLNCAIARETAHSGKLLKLPGFAYARTHETLYAIQSLVEIWERGTGIIEPDYTKSVCEVHEDVVKHQVEHLHSLHLLQYCDLDESNQDMPTWVSDWSRPLIRFGLKYYSASGYSSSDVQFPGKGILQATGLLAATIQSVCTCRTGKTLRSIG